MSCFTDHGSVDKETSTPDVREDQKKSPTDVVTATVSDGSEDGEVKDELPVRTKRSPSVSIEEPPPKKLRLAPEPMAPLFTEMRRTSYKTSCVISVNRNQGIGGLYPVHRGFAINIHVNPGPEYAPLISLGFRTTGAWTAQDGARIEWDTEAVYKRRFAISNFAYGHASPDAPDPIGSNPKVLDLCENKDMSRLLYIRFDSWDQSAGFSTKNAFKDQDRAIKKAMETIFQPERPYHMEIWFLAPFHPRAFQTGCLSYFTDSVRSRQNTLHNWQDGRGNRYIDTPPTSRPTTRPHKSMGKHMFRVKKVPQAQDAGKARNEVAAKKSAQDASMAGRSTSPRLDEQMSLTVGAGPTSALVEGQVNSPREFIMPEDEPLRSRRLMPRSDPLRSRASVGGFMPEFMMDMPDTSIAGRSIFSDSEEQTMPTPGAGPTSPPAEGLNTSPPGSAGGFIMPRSRLLPFMPSMMLDSIDDSTGAIHHDSDIEPEPDAGRDDFEEGQQEDEEEDEGEDEGEGNDPSR